MLCAALTNAVDEHGQPVQCSRDHHSGDTVADDSWVYFLCAQHHTMHLDGKLPFERMVRNTNSGHPKEGTVNLDNDYVFEHIDGEKLAEIINSIYNSNYKAKDITHVISVGDPLDPAKPGDIYAGSDYIGHYRDGAFTWDRNEYHGSTRLEGWMMTQPPTVHRLMFVKPLGDNRFLVKWEFDAIGETPGEAVRDQWAKAINQHRGYFCFALDPAGGKHYFRQRWVGNKCHWEKYQPKEAAKLVRKNS